MADQGTSGGDVPAASAQLRRSQGLQGRIGAQSVNHQQKWKAQKVVWPPVALNQRFTVTVDDFD
jgi:hypothetical protein